MKQSHTVMRMTAMEYDDAITEVCAYVLLVQEPEPRAGKRSGDIRYD